MYERRVWKELLLIGSACAAAMLLRAAVVRADQPFSVKIIGPEFALRGDKVYLRLTETRPVKNRVWTVYPSDTKGWDTSSDGATGDFATGRLGQYTFMVSVTNEAGEPAHAIHVVNIVSSLNEGDTPTSVPFRSPQPPAAALPRRPAPTATVRQEQPPRPAPPAPMPPEREPDPTPASDPPEPEPEPPQIAEPPVVADKPYVPKDFKPSAEASGIIRLDANGRVIGRTKPRAKPDIVIDQPPTDRTPAQLVRSWLDDVESPTCRQDAKVIADTLRMIVGGATTGQINGDIVLEARRLSDVNTGPRVASAWQEWWARLQLMFDQIDKQMDDDDPPKTAQERKQLKANGLSNVARILESYHLKGTRR